MTRTLIHYAIMIPLIYWVSAYFLSGKDYILFKHPIKYTLYYYGILVVIYLFNRLEKKLNNKRNSH